MIRVIADIPPCATTGCGSVVGSSHHAAMNTAWIWVVVVLVVMAAAVSTYLVRRSRYKRAAPGAPLPAESRASDRR